MHWVKLKKMHICSFILIMYTDISPAEFKLKIQAPDTVVLDVRTYAETSEVALPGALTGLDFYNGEFESAFRTLDKNKTYLVYCRSGVRSGYACEMMAAEGFNDLYNLRGGIIAWMNDAE